MSLKKRDTIKENKLNETLLLKKGKRGILRIVFGRTGIVILLLLVQVVLLYLAFRLLGEMAPYLVSASIVLSIVIVIYIINSEHNTNVKMTWIVLIMISPGFGGLLYVFIQRDVGHRALKKRLKEIIKESRNEFVKQEGLMEKLELENKGLYNLAYYTGQVGGYPVYEGSSTKYFPIGEEAFEEILIQLKKAKKFIFLEFFIVEEGYMWGQMLSILADKVKEGVEVRMIYDGTNEFALLPRSYSRKLNEIGIKTKVFAPIRPFLSTHYNYRDHRKILVIDGNIGFTGGINLADEYINKIEVYGHWKDTVIMVEGKAVESFTLMFMQMWNIREEDRSYMGERYKSSPLKEKAKGYVLPFGDSPLDKDKVGQMIYMDILNRAEDYVHIMTPYLIIDGEMITALQFAARRGVDVKIIMPRIPDKKFVFAQSRSYYKELMRFGVEIYEYVPGFMHAKSFVSDGKKGVVGTINLDYRSLYHHFECGVYIEDVEIIEDIELDFSETLKQSEKVTLEQIKNYNLFMTLAAKTLRLVAPLM